MRLRHRSGRLVHLSSGVNIRAARDLPAVINRLDTYASAIRARLDVDTLGVSLWLPPSLAAALAVDGRLRTRLRDELDARGLEVVTLSGVPYAEGGGEASAGGADEPDWSDPARLEYTLDLARILVDLLPDDAVRGAVTTMGMGRRAGWNEAKEKATARIMGRLSARLAEVAWHTGRAVQVGMRPEPGCVLDATDETIAALARVGKERIGVCLDLASLACTWEEPADTLSRLAAAGISVIRADLSVAVEVAQPPAALAALRAFVRPGEPHPVTNPSGAHVDDLPEALEEMPPGPWRVRRIVPLHVAPPAPLTATVDVWRGALRELVGGPAPVTEYLHVPAEGTPAEAAADFAYTWNELESLGLSPPHQARAA
jgi:sugar phosphate isomerase/epimerase